MFGFLSVEFTQKEGEMSDVLGRFTWYELMTTDPEAAIRFYGDVVGWSTQKWDGGPQPYTMWMAGEMPVGGVMALPEEAQAAGAPPHWMAYIGTPDLDATVSKAVELGGQVVWGPMDIPEVGRMAGIADPQGAMFAAHQPASEMPPAGEPHPGCFSWNELWTSDQDAAFDFYSALFGWQKTTAMDMGEAGTYQMYGRPGGPDLGGIANRPPEMPMSAWLYYAMVPDADEAASKTEAQGGQIRHGPMEVPGGDRVAMAADPQGAAFAVHSKKAG